MSARAILGAILRIFAVLLPGMAGDPRARQHRRLPRADSPGPFVIPAHAGIHLPSPHSARGRKAGFPRAREWRPTAGRTGECAHQATDKKGEYLFFLLLLLLYFPLL